MTSSPSRRASRDFFDSYTKDLNAEDLQRLFTRDTRDAYKFFTRGATPTRSITPGCRWHRRAAAAALFFLAFTMKLSPARRVVYGGSLILALIGIVKLFRRVRRRGLPLRLPFVGRVGVLRAAVPEGTLVAGHRFALMNLLVLLEVADRLSLKNDLEIARDIQQAMLPSGLYTAPAASKPVGMSRPANTVGGDFYDILPLDDGRLVVDARRRRRQGQPGRAADGAAARDDAHAGRREARAGAR